MYNQQIPVSENPPAINTLSSTPHKPNALLIGLGAIVLLGLGLLGGYFLFSPKNTSQQNINQITQISPTEIPSPVTSENTNWKTYINTESGFSFQYPSNWVITQPTQIPTYYSQEIIFTDSLKDIKYDHRLIIYVEKSRPYTQVVAQLSGGDAGMATKTEQKEEITVGGHPATKTIVVYSEAGLDMEWKETSKSPVVVIDRMYPLTLQFSEDMDTKTLDQVIETFKFTN